jgi:Protein of unknown function (DUF4242)
MSRFVVERTFPGGLALSVDAAGVHSCMQVVEANTLEGVTWVHSYVSEDRETTFCVYDAPDAGAVVRAAERNGLPVDRITRVSVLDPYFLAPETSGERSTS